MHELFDLPQGLELALYWAARGSRVHPVRYIPATETHKAQKKPMLPTWQRLATIDEVKIRRWWGKWPDAWVGLATGAPGLDVIDFDVADGAPGKASFEALLEAGLIDTYLFEVNTPSGGWHRAFPGTGQRNSQIESAGVDFRSTGGFVMAPGNPGYEVTSVPAAPELAEPVDWAACKALLQPGRAPASRPAAPPPNQPASPGTPVPPIPTQRKPNGLVSPRPDDSWSLQQAQAEIHRWRGILAAAKIGSINHTLNNTAMRLGRFIPAFLDWAHAVTILESALALTDYDGKTWQANDTIRSGLMAGMRQPYERRPDDAAPATRPPSPPAKQDGAPGIAAPPPTVEGISNQRKPMVQKASEIQVRRVRWLWEGRIPTGEITLIAGREGSGKSTFLAWLARAITRGELPGEYQGTPRAVLYAAAEDSWEHTLAPRLLAAGADLDLVYRVAIQIEAGTETNLVLPLDIEPVFAMGEQLGAVALMLDPGLSFLDSRVDSFKSQELRPALEALRRGAERHGMSVPMLCHFNKTQGTDVLSKIAGSRAFAEVARAALAVAAEIPETEDGEPADEHVILSQVKNNLGRSNLPSLTYQIHDTAVPTSEGDAHVGRLVWTGETDRSAEQVLNGIAEKTPRKQPDKQDEVQVWIVAQGRTCSVEEIHAAFPQINRVTLRKRLSRLAEAGGIYRPMQGHYAPAHAIGGPDHTVTPVTPSRTPDTGSSENSTTGTGDTDSVTSSSPPSRVTSVSSVTPPVPQFHTSVTRERERDKSDSVTGDGGVHARARVTLRSPQPADDDGSWLVHGDRYTQGT